MGRGFFDKLLGKKTLSEVDSWNVVGRKIVAHNTAEITAFHEGEKESPEMRNDPRSPQLANKVLEEVVRLNKEGRGREARNSYDPAHSPFVERLEAGTRGLKFCAILGADEYLVQQGNSHSERTLWHISGGKISKEASLKAFAFSKNRKFFLSIDEDNNILVSSSYKATPIEKIPAIKGKTLVPKGLPEGLSNKYETPGDQATYSHVAVSDDGKKFLLCDVNRGVIVLTKSQEGWNSELIYPSMATGLEEQMREWLKEEESYRPSLDMAHSALSPDGRFAAVGDQSFGHFLIDLKIENGAKLYAHLGYLSEYPHDACFSDDGAYVSLNSCHFYNGATFASEVAAVEGKTTKPYEKDPLQTILNNYLRVYASGYVPQSLTSAETGAFLLAGAGFAVCVTPSGKLLWEVGFGSSAGGVDICPKTGQVLIASYSGMLHLLNPLKVQAVPIFSGYKPRQEMRRWLFWDSLDSPIEW